MKTRMTRVMALAAGLVLFGATPVLYADEAANHVEVLGKGTKDDRRAALKALQALGSDAGGALLNGLTHSNFIARGDCARLLGVHGGADALDALIIRTKSVEVADGASEEEVAEALKTGEPVASVRAAATAAIGEIAKRDAAATEKATGALRGLVAEGHAPEVRYEAVRGLAKLADAADRATMNQLLTKEGDPAFGVLAVDYLAALNDADAHQTLVSFVTAEETVGEGEEAKTQWPFGKGWEHARTLAVTALVEAGHPRGAELLVADAARSSRSQSIVVPMYRDLAAKYGDAIVPPVIAALEKIARDKPGQRPSEMLALMGLLIPTGETGVRAIVELMDRGIAEQKAALETDPAARNPFSQVFTTAITNTDSMTSKTDFVSHPATRAAMLAVYLERPAPAEGETDDVRKQFYDALLASRSPEARRVMVDTFNSSDESKVTQAMDAFTELAGADGISELEPLSEHSSDKVREHLVLKLSDSRMPVSRTRALLIKLSNDKAPSVRKQVWRPLGQSEDRSMLQEFARGMKDPAMEVQYEAAKYLNALLTKLKVSEDSQKDVFEDATALVAEKMNSETDLGAIQGLSEIVSQLENTLWRNNKEGLDEFKDKLRGLVTHSDPDLRSSAGERAFVLKNPEFMKSLVSQLKQETEATAAYGLLMGLDSQFKELPSDVTPASLVPDVAKWLGRDDVKNRFNLSRNTANSATNLLNKIYGHGPDGSKAVTEELKKILTEGNKAKKDGTLPTDDAAKRERMIRVANAINTMTRVRSGDSVDLVIDTMVTWSDSSNVTSFARSYLEAFAQPTHKEKIKAIDVNVLSDAFKNQILRQIDMRSGAADGQ